MMDPIVTNTETPAAEKIEKKDEDLVKMYVLVNSELKMGKGKIAAQVGHGVAAMIRYMERNAKSQPAYVEWCSRLEAKIVLQASESEMFALATTYRHPSQGGDVSRFSVPVIDAGRTQIEAGSFTVLAFNPLRKSDVPAKILELKLL